jgi:HPt (histidine-containing phosphotransfer) domain-containing protein
MNTPPIVPTTSASGSAAGDNLPPSQQAQNDLDTISKIDEQIEQALANGASPAQIQALVQQLKQPMQDLANIASQLSPSEASLIENAEQQYASFTQKEEAITPTSIALFQGTCDTCSQVISAPSGANINIETLQDQNQLSELANALQLQMQGPEGSRNNNCEEILKSMKTPLKDLINLAQNGELSSDQRSDLQTINDFYNDNFQKYETTTPSTVSQFQDLLNKLNNALISG